MIRPERNCMRTVARAKLIRLDLARHASHHCRVYKRLGWSPIALYCNLLWYKNFLLDSHKFEVQGKCTYKDERTYIAIPRVPCGHETIF